MAFEVTELNRCTLQIRYNNTEFGYVDTAKGSSVAGIIERGSIADSELAKLFDLLDERDGEKYPERTVSFINSKNVTAKELHVDVS